MSAIRGRFIEPLPSNGLGLDAGCGAGRDIKAFLEMGLKFKRLMLHLQWSITRVNMDLLEFAN